MEIATVTSKGQITIPISIRKLLNLDKGDKVILDEENGKIVMINASRHLNMDQLVFSSKPTSTADALEDIEPFDWDDDVIRGKRKVSVKNGRN